MNKIKVGDIINTHGIKGELKVLPTSDESFDREIDYYIDDKLVNVEYSRFHKNTILVKFKNYDNINDVLIFKSKTIYISEDDLLELEEDEYYVKDLVDSKVVDENNQEIGILDDILEYEANDVYVVKNGEKEYLIPAVAEFILDIDTENKIIKVKLIEGM